MTMGGDGSSSPSSGGDEGDVLDFGTSIEVNDNLRREILVEMNDIKATNEITKREINHELKTEHDIRKALQNALVEMKELSQNAASYLEHTNVNCSFVVQLKRQFQMDIVKPTMEKSTTSTQPQAVSPDGSRTAGNTEEEARSEKENYGAMIKIAKAKIDVLSDKLSALSRDIYEGRGKIEEIVVKRDNLEKGQQEIGLRESLYQAKESLKNLRVEEKEDKLYSISLKESIVQSREALGILQKNLTELVSYGREYFGFVSI